MNAQVYVNGKKSFVKELFFSDSIMDGRHKVQLFNYETGLTEDIEFYIDVNNGIRRVSGKNIKIVENKFDGSSSNVVENDNMIVLYDIQTKIKIGLLVFASNENNILFKKYDVNMDITVGTGGDIQYTSNSGGNLFGICYDSGKAFVEPYINRIYLNGVKITGKTRIRFGECVLYNKFKLIYLGNIVAINNPDGYVKTSLREHIFKEDTSFSAVVSAEENLYTEYFTRAPRITHKLISEDVTVDPPPSKAKKDDKPLIYTMGPSLTMSLGMIISMIFMMRARASGSSMIPSAMMAVTMLTGAVLWPILSRRYNNRKLEENEKLRKQKYGEYIDEIDKSLAEKTVYNRSIYEELYPSMSTLEQCVLSKNSMLWNHATFDDGFLDVRIGRGTKESTIKISTQKERFTLEEDELKEKAFNLQNKYMYLSNVPIAISLKDTAILGIVGDKVMRMSMLKLMVMRLAITHSYDEVKIAIIYKEKDAEQWNFAKWLPHCWGAGKKIRYISQDRDGASYVISQMRDIYNERENEENENNGNKSDSIPRYIVFVTDYELIKGDSYILEFIENSREHGITFVLAYDTIQRLPSTCDKIVQLSKKESTIYDKTDESGKMSIFVPDIADKSDFEKLSYILSGIKISEAAEEASVPERLTFLEMYRAKTVEDLVIERRWKESQPHKTLEAPLGIGANNETFALDIRVHGPHGLMAGTTGSGKSECIQSYILSMAINYEPYDVGFVLIDYKGGGMANAFVDLPHVMATITNLDGGMINRSLTSLESEVKRRQEVFARESVNTIGAYQMKFRQGLVSEPMPRLIIIADEFAELKSQQPEFMGKLISIARIGRSLGVNLILATQKPSGVVNDQIWANTNFRICLKVADKSDSREMLKRPEAAYITIPGRCYVQIGNDEIFKLLQTGYSGAKYVRDAAVEDNVDKNISYIDLQGNEVYTVNGGVSDKNKKENLYENTETQLEAIVKELKRIAEEQGIKQRRLWLDPLPSTLMFSGIDKRKGGFNGKEWLPCEEWLDPYIGIYDNPEKQSRGEVDVNLGEFGHMILYGAPGTGKTTFIQTLVYSMAKRYSPEDFYMYILDFSSRSLGYFKQLPHVGDVILSDDEGKVRLLMKKISEELNRRKKTFSELDVGNIKSYMDASGKKEPALIIVIDGYSTFYENYGEYEDFISRLTREGVNYGIWLIITAMRQVEVKTRISSYIKLYMTLQLNDKYDYLGILGRDKDRMAVIPENTPGRGLFKKEVNLEYQTAIAGDEENDAQRAAKLKEEFIYMTQCWHGDTPKAIPVMPDDMDFDSVVTNNEYTEPIKAGLTPIGYNTETIEVMSVKMEEIPVFKITGDTGMGRKNCLALILELTKDAEVWLIDDEYGSVERRLKNKPVKYVKAEETNKMVEMFMEELLKRHISFKEYKENGGEDEKSVFMQRYNRIVFAIADFEKYFDILSDENSEEIIKYANSAFELRTNIISVSSTAANTKFRIPIKTKRFIDCTEGICMGKADNISTAFPMVNVPSDVKRRYPAEVGTGFLVSKSDYCRVMMPLIK